MWSWSQRRASTAHQGKTQWPSRRMTSSRIQSGGSCSSTAVWVARSRTGRMVTWEWPTHSLILVRVAGPSLSTDADRLAAVEVQQLGQGQVQVEPGLGLARLGGLDRLDHRGLVSAEEASR